ncbi:MAG TPA: hypothetical protein VMF30_13155 [Pirellulales bacterium]|nr:hypothetical protein [Pirellulales bacterium]
MLMVTAVTLYAWDLWNGHTRSPETWILGMVIAFLLAVRCFWISFKVGGLQERREEIVKERLDLIAAQRAKAPAGGASAPNTPPATPG